MRSRVLHHDIRRRRARRRRALWTGGELLCTVGVLLLLLVVHQLWWTNREAKEGAERRVEALEREWSGDEGAQSDAPAAASAVDGSATTAPSAPASAVPPAPASARVTRTASQGYAVLTVPRLNLRVPVAEGVGRQTVLNKGYVGHYPGTQQPGQAGNFALAGHRNTHGEPFRYLNRLKRQDTIRVETRTAIYTYEVTRTLPQTSARDSGVIRPIPRSTVHPAYGYSTPGYYITLTTCTPEYTSRYRLVVWGTLVSMRPRN